MGKKRNPKSKRVHDSDTGKFIPESSVDGLTPFGYNDDEKGTVRQLIGAALVFLAIVLVVAYAFGYIQF